MSDSEVIVYNISCFICALFLLEYGADKFIDHTAILARRTGVSETLVALLTAGAEWEELAIIVISIVRQRPSLAIGNIVGSAISNILGAFSLGLLFIRDSSDTIIFDNSSKFYSAFLLGVTSLIAALLSFSNDIDWRVVGGILIGAFTIYLMCVFYAIRKGLMTAPELSDSDEDDGSVDDNAHASQVTGQAREPTEEDGLITGASCQSEQMGTFWSDTEQGQGVRALTTTSNGNNGLFPTSRDPSLSSEGSGITQHNLFYHLVQLLLGLAALILSAYVLSSAAAILTTEFGISDVLSGIVILSIATTIPEKFVAAVSSSRGHTGIMVANTVGSNIFLLTLCMGILLVATGHNSNQDKLTTTELVVLVGSSALMTAIVWLGARSVRLIGAVLLTAYIAFIILEFIVIRPV